MQILYNKINKFYDGLTIIGWSFDETIDDLILILIILDLLIKSEDAYLKRLTIA